MPRPKGKKKTQDFRRNAKRISFMRRHRTAFRHIILGASLIVTMSFSYLSYSLWKSGFIRETSDNISAKVENAEYRAAKAFGLTLKNVYLEGQKYSTAKEIMEAAGLKIDQPIFMIDLAGLKSRIEGLRWVKHVDIEREIPNTLHIKVTEKMPAAIWQNKGNLALIDDNGEVISYKHIEEFSDLPIIVGQDADGAVSELFKLLNDQPELKSRISSVIRIAGRRWNIRLKNNIEIMLPEENVAESLEYLAYLEREKKLFERQIKSVDLRVPDRLFIQGLSAADPDEKEKPLIKKNSAKQVEGNKKYITLLECHPARLHDGFLKVVNG